MTARFEEAVASAIVGLRRYARTIVGRDAEDVVQDALLRAWRHYPSWRGDGPIEAWLLAICRNVALDELRRRSRRPVEAPMDVEPLRTDPTFMRVELADLVGRLHVAHREVVVLVDVLGHDYGTVAEILDVPVGTVRSRLFRARDALVAMEAAARRAESA
jgi:RNA polymerase sigma-70 factor (ECF subfamily)